MSIPYTLIRSPKRTTAVIQIGEKGIVVRAPAWVTDDWVNSWLSSKQAWIERESSRFRTHIDAHAIKLVQGGQIPFKGSEITLHWRRSNRTDYHFDGAVLDVQLSSRSKRPDEEQLKDALQKWYRKEATHLMSRRIEHWQTVMKVKATDVRVRDYKRRWGSCSAKGVVSFNWRLIFGELALIDYVIIHELAHLVHLDHSKAFWSLVELYCPDWKSSRKALKNRVGWILW